MSNPRKISFMFEITDQCNQQCEFCFNTWKSTPRRNRRRLDSRRTLRLLEKVIAETGCYSITLSGGEPLLREDLFEIIAFIKERNVKVSLVSNGVLLTRRAIDLCLAAGVDIFQITLLGDRPELHDRLAGGPGFEAVLEAILTIKSGGGRVYTSFTCLADNVESFPGVMELNALLGVRNVAFGRFLPGGRGLRDWRRFLPSPDSLVRALQAADELSCKYRIAVSVSTPILPCLVDVARFRNIRFSYCHVGDSEHAIYGIDPEGNLKVCSHSPAILGNLLDTPFSELVKNPFLDEFKRALPDFCRACLAKDVCKGGCRSSAHVCYDDPSQEDPYLQCWRSVAKRPVVHPFPAGEPGAEQPASAGG